MPPLFTGARWRRLRARTHGHVECFALRGCAGAEMKLPGRLISNVCDRGRCLFFQSDLPVVIEQVSLELDLFDRWRERDVDRTDPDSANTIRNARARIKNRSCTRNFHRDVLAVAEIKIALQ